MEPRLRSITARRRPTVAWSTCSARAAPRSVCARPSARNTRASSQFMGLSPDAFMHPLDEITLHDCIIQRHYHDEHPDLDPTRQVLLPRKPACVNSTPLSPSI